MLKNIKRRFFGDRRVYPKENEGFDGERKNAFDDKKFVDSLTGEVFPMYPGLAEDLNRRNKKKHLTKKQLREAKLNLNRLKSNSLTRSNWKELYWKEKYYDCIGNKTSRRSLSPPPDHFNSSFNDYQSPYNSPPPRTPPPSATVKKRRRKQNVVRSPTRVQPARGVKKAINFSKMMTRNAQKP